MADIILDLATCLQYNDLNGDKVTKILIQNYVSLLGNKVCSLITTVNGQSNVLSALSQQISSLNQKINAIPVYELPKLYPTGIASPTIALSLDVFTALLEQQFVQERNATGNPQEIFNSISNQVIGLDVALGTSGGKLGDTSGWISSPNSLANSYYNIGNVIKDLRSAVRNLQLNFTSFCEGIAIVLQGTYANKNLKLFFTGTIPDYVNNLEAGGSLFTIKDQSGNFVQQKIDIKANINGSAGITIDLSSSPLNFADDLTITSIYGFSNLDSGSVCQKSFELIVVNSSLCPVLTISEGINSATVQFINNLGTITYIVEVYNTMNEVVQVQNRTVTGTTNVNIVFNNLVSSTLYKVRLRMATLTSTRICQFTSFTTLPNACPSPNNVSATLEYV